MRTCCLVWSRSKGALRRLRQALGTAFLLAGGMLLVPLQASGAAEGLASYYGHGFHGRRTASGQRFDQRAMTAAHRTLRFGTKVRVIHAGNGRSVVVTINDRGPFIRGRVIDLSRAAAHRLGMLGAGIAPVHLEVVGDGTGAVPRSAGRGGELLLLHELF